MWMKSARSPYSDFTCSVTSVTGPHTRLWHSAGVANSSTTGRLCLRASTRSTACMSSGGTRVSIDLTLPCADVTVGVWTEIALSPGPGRGSSGATITSAGEVATSLRFSLATADTRYEPALGKLTCATYTDCAAFESWAVV